MDKNLRTIFHTRYRAVLLLFIVGFFSIYVGGGVTTVKNWNNQNIWLHSEDFQKEFKDPINPFYKYYDDEENKIPYQDIEEYQLERLTLFNNPFYDTSFTSAKNRFKPDQSYQRGNNYWDAFDNSFIPLIPLVLFLLSFALFFIDLKTNFNALLFSLPFSKKQLFRGKILYFGIPLMLTSIIGSIIYQVTIYWLIPDIYVNATLGQMLYSGLSHWIFLLFAFLSGSFLGTLLGNLVTGPLLIIAGLISLTQRGMFLSYSVHLFDYLGLSHFTRLLRQIFGSFPTIVIGSLGKAGSTYTTLFVFLLLTVILFVIAEKIYENTSLENNGKVLTVPRYRRRFFIILALASSIYFMISSIDIKFYLDYYGHLPVTLLILTTTACTVSSFILTYYDEIFKFWNKRYLNRVTKKIQ